MILDRTRRGGSRPTTDDVDRRLGAGRDLDRTMTTAEWLDEWFAGKHDLRGTTRRYYASNIRVYLKPRLGDIPLDRLRITHLTAMFEWIEATNHTRRRPVGRATMRQIRGTLRSSLSDAVRQGLVTRNVAKDVRLAGGKTPKARVWTAARIAAFEAECRRRAEERHAKRTKHCNQAVQVTFKEWSTTARPSPVMVWTPAQTNVFLTTAREDRLYALYHLIVHRGLRRGEAVGLPWTEVDFDEGTITISQQIVQIGWETDQGEPKTDSGGRTIPLDAETIEVLRSHRAAQLAEQAEWDDLWTDTGLVFTREDGTALHPETAAMRFERLAFRAGLPPIRLHDLRHVAATHRFGRHPRPQARAGTTRPFHHHPDRQHLHHRASGGGARGGRGRRAPDPDRRARSGCDHLVTT
jgi:integrase